MGSVNYDQDFYGWTVEQVALLQNKQFDQIDLEHIIEEIDSMGKAERNQLRNRLTVLLMHLLKWQYEPSRRSTSWVQTIREQRRSIVWLIEDNPSLKSTLSEQLTTAYGRAVDEAADETKLPLNLFPTECPWTYAEFMNKEFFPE